MNAIRFSGSILTLLTIIFVSHSSILTFGQSSESEDEVKSIVSTSNPDLTIGSVSSFFRSDSFNIVGEVLNTSDETKEYVKLSVTLYDSNNKVIGTDFTFTDPSDIFPQDSAPFSVLITDSDVSSVKDISSYKIQVSSL
jgi:hypothetical protein